MDVPVELSRILISELGEEQVIFLRELDGERQFPILIGISEALAIDRRLKGIETPRPLTHELLATVIGALGGTLERIVINDLWEHTFIATLFVRQNGGVLEIDARPSDAIALGAALETPLFVAEHVIAAATSAQPSTTNERLEILRQRLEFLGEQIAAFTEMLENPDYQDSNPPEVVTRRQSQLAEMQAEYEAIQTVLRKLG